MRIAEIEKVDGLLLVGEDWRMFRPLWKFTLFPSLQAQILGENSFKGVDFKAGLRQLIKLPLGYVMDQNTITLVLAMKENTYDLQFYGTTIRDLANQVVQNFGLQSSTFTDWCQYSTNVGRRVVFAKDLHAFGNQITRRMLDDVPECDKIFIVVGQLGQDIDYSSFEGTLQPYDLNFVCQMIVHYAVDFCKPGSCLFANRERLLSQVRQRYLKQEYNVCLLKGFGNFYFQPPDLVAHKDVKFVELKVYSEAFKQFHRGEYINFTQPVISKMLLDPRHFSPYFCCQNLLKPETHVGRLICLAEYVQMLQTESLKIRAEVILRLEKEHVLNAVVQIPLLVREHSMIKPSKLKPCFSAVSSADLHDHLRINLLPFVRTIKFFLELKVQAQIGGYFDQFTPERYLCCLASEAVVCFALYGNVHYRGGKYLYPAWLQEALFLKRSDYLRDGQMMQWLFQNVRPGETIQFSSDQLQISPVLRPILQKCKTEMAQYYMPIEKLETFVRFNGQEDTNECQQIYKSIAEMLLAAVVDGSHYEFNHSLPRGFRTTSVDLKLRRLAQLQNHVPFCLIDVQDFVERLFANKLTPHGFLNWLVQVVRFISGPGTFQEILSATVVLFEERLFANGCFLVVPVTNLVHPKLIVVPIRGTRAVNYQTIGRQQQINICRMYEQYFEPACICFRLQRTLCQDCSNLRLGDILGQIERNEYVPVVIDLD